MYNLFYFYFYTWGETVTCLQYLNKSRTFSHSSALELSPHLSFPFSTSLVPFINPQPHILKPKTSQPQKITHIIHRLQNSPISYAKHTNGSVYCSQKGRRPNPFVQAIQPNSHCFSSSLSFSLLQHQHPALQLPRGRPVGRR